MTKHLSFHDDQTFFIHQTERVTQAPSSPLLRVQSRYLSRNQGILNCCLMEGWFGLPRYYVKWIFSNPWKKRKTVTATWKSGMLFKMREEELGNKAESRIFLTVELRGRPFLLWKAAMLCTGWFSICTHSGVKGASFLTAVVKNK